MDAFQWAGDIDIGMIGKVYISCIKICYLRINTNPRTTNSIQKLNVDMDKLLVLYFQDLSCLLSTVPMVRSGRPTLCSQIKIKVQLHS